MSTNSNTYCCLFYERRDVKNKLYAMFRNQMAEVYSVKAQAVSKGSCKITPRHVERTLDTI